MLTDEQINSMVLKIEALEPHTRETVLLFLDFLEQVQEKRKEALANHRQEK